ncbi:MAG: PPC domain-containing protein [Chloroflexota bacterium]|nr:PPC domain-containing protein [Chloroflexota bacterium]
MSFARFTLGMARRVPTLMLVLFVFVAPIHAQILDFVPFAWDAADLSLVIPAGWTPDAPSDVTTQTFRLTGDGVLIVRILPETTTDAQLYPQLIDAMIEANVFANPIARTTWFGRMGWFASGFTYAGDGYGASRIGRLPDDRPIMVIGIRYNDLGAAGRASAEGLTDTVAASIAFSAALPPLVSPCPRLDCPPERTGDTLMLDVPVQGTSNGDTAHEWFYDGRAGETVTVSAVDLARLDPFELRLDMEIIVYAPDGTEIAADDDHGGADLYGVYDAQIRDLFLVTDGRYRIVVRGVQGTRGTYTLGISAARTFAFDADGVARLSGRIQGVFPRQRWQFEGRAGQILTITMQTTSGTLDPILELYSPTGRQTASNDDAADPAFGVNAQIVRVELPRDGVYTLDATRYAGTGAYSIIVAQS